MATFIFFDEFKKSFANGDIDIDGDSFVMYLSNAAPTAATHILKAELANITEQNGYTETVLTTTWAETGGGTGIWRFAGNADISWTASGGSFGPFQYVNVYDTTPTTPLDPLVGWWDVGSATTITTGNTFTVDLDANFEIFTLDG